jgi:hypothetical protein
MPTVYLPPPRAPCGPTNQDLISFSLPSIHCDEVPTAACTRTRPQDHQTLKGTPMNADRTTLGGHGDDAGRVRAVIYARTARMDSLKSIESQCEETRKYAACHNLEVIGVYADIGKSGSSVEERDEMKRLLSDVATPGREFSVILIYDWSRWGRSLDVSDTYHEYLCRRAGVEICVCIEPPAADSYLIHQVARHTRRATGTRHRIGLPHKRDILRVPSRPRRHETERRRPWRRTFRGQI